MHTLLQRLEGDMAMNLSSLQFLKLDPSVRSRAAEALVPVSKMKVPLYILVMQVDGAHGRGPGYAIHRAGRCWANNYARSSEEAFNPSFRYSIPIAFGIDATDFLWCKTSTFY